MNGRLLLLVSLLAGAAAAATGLPSKEMCGLQIPVIPESGVKTKGSMLGSGSGGAVTRTEKLDGADLPYDTVVKRFSGVSSFVKETLASQILCSASTCPPELPLTPLVAAVVDESSNFKDKSVFGSAGSITLEDLFQRGTDANVAASWRKIVDASTFIAPGSGAQAGRVTALRELDTGLAILQQLALAVQHMRERNFVHQDIKHQNAMCGDDGACRLIDMDRSCHTSEVIPADGRGKSWPAELRGFDPQCPARLADTSSFDTSGLACSFMSRAGNSVYQSPLAGLVQSAVRDANAWSAVFDGSADVARRSYGTHGAPSMDLVGMLDVYSLGFLALELLTGTEQPLQTGVLAANELSVTGTRDFNNNIQTQIFTEGEKAPRDEMYSQTLVLALQKFLNLDRWTPGPSDEGERLTADHRMLAVLKSLAQHLPSNRPAGSHPIFHFRDASLGASLAGLEGSTSASAASAASTSDASASASGSGSAAQAGSVPAEAAAARASLRKAHAVAQQALQAAGAEADAAIPAAAALLEVAEAAQEGVAETLTEAGSSRANAHGKARTDSYMYAGRDNNANIAYQTCPLCEFLRVTHKDSRDTETAIPLVFQAKDAKAPTYMSTRHGDPSTENVGMTILRVGTKANAVEPAAPHLAERIPPTQVATASLMRLLRRMLSLHAEEVPTAGEVASAIDVIRMQVYVQEGAAVPEADTHALEDHLGCVKACVAVAGVMMTGPGETAAPAKDAICAALEAPLHTAAKFCAATHDALSAYSLGGKKLPEVMATPNALSQAAASSICRRSVCKAGAAALMGGALAGRGEARRSNRLSLVSNADMEALQSHKPIDFTKAKKGPVTASVFHGWRWAHMRSIRIEAGAKKGDPPTLAWWAPDAPGDSPAKNRFPVSPAFGAGPCSVMATIPGFPDIRGGCGAERGFCACAALQDTRSTEAVKPLLTIRILFAKEAEGLRFINVLHQAITDANVKA